MKIIKIIFTFLLLFVCPLSALAWTGKVVGVHDGDTITIERDNGTPGGTREKIRLFGVDTPEMQVPGKWETQPYGRVAANFVRDMLKGKERVSIFEMGESYGRIVGAVIQLDNGVTVQEQLVSEGLAWVDPRYCKDSIKECKNWKDLQEKAKKKRKGLWKDKNPVAPWDWRRGGGSE